MPFPPQGSGVAVAEVATSCMLWSEEEDGTTVYYTKNGITGDVTRYDTLSAAWTGALSELTAGRTWQEEVVLIGELTTDAQLETGDNVVVNLYNAEVDLGGNHHMFIITGDKVTFLGGMLNGNKAIYNTDLWCGVATDGTRREDITIKDVAAHDFNGKGIYLKGLGVYLENCRTYSNGQDGIYFEGSLPATPCEDVCVINCESWSNGRKGFNNGIIHNVEFIGCESHENTEDGWNIEGGTGVALDYYWTDVTLIRCKAYENIQNGYRAQMGGRRLCMEDCEGYSNQSNGAYIRGRDDAWNISELKIIGGSYHENELNGILLAYGIKYLKLIGPSVFNNDQSNGGYDGISVGNQSANQTHWLFDDVYTYDDQGAPTQDRGLDLGVYNYAGQQIVVTTLMGSGNTIALLRQTGAITHFTPPA